MENALSKNEPCPNCGRYACRAITIDAIIASQAGILLIKRGNEPYKGYWALPGGHVDWDETVEDAVKREVKEETGVIVKSLKMLGVYSKPDRDPKQKITVVYFTETEGEPKAGDDAKECRYFPLNNLPSDIAFDHKQIIQDYFGKQNGA